MISTTSRDDTPPGTPTRSRMSSLFRKRTSSVSSIGSKASAVIKRTSGLSSSSEEDKSAARYTKSPESQSSPSLDSLTVKPLSPSRRRPLVESPPASASAAAGAQPTRRSATAQAPVLLPAQAQAQASPKNSPRTSSSTDSIHTPPPTPRTRHHHTSWKRSSHSPPPALPQLPAHFLPTRSSSSSTTSTSTAAAVMPPKSAKSKSRAEARKDKKQEKEKAAASVEDQSSEDKNNASSVDDNNDGDDTSDAEGFEDAEGGDEEHQQQQRDSTSVESQQPESNQQSVDEQAGEEKAAQEPVTQETTSQESPSTQESSAEKETAPASQTDALPDSVDSVASAIDAPQSTETTDSTTSSSVSVEQPKTTTAADKTASPTALTPTAATVDLPPTSEQAAATAAPAPPPRNRSQSSLWDRLKTPAERAAAAADKETNGGPSSSASPNGAPPTLPRRPSQAASSFLSSITSAANYAATSAASRGFQLPERLGGGPAAAASLAATPAERRRLPRHAVDEAQMMEDQMRFAEARHVLATSRDLEVIRKLGKDLEEGWREKLAQVTELHLQMEDLTNSVSDIEDENNQLRLQMAALSEQIVHREEDFESFQRLTVAHQEREKELWSEEGREEKELMQWKEREAVRILAEERAINAQLRIVLLGSLKDGENGSLAPHASHTGALGKSARLSLMPGGTSSDSRRRTAVFDSQVESSATGDSTPSASGSQSPALQRSRDSGVPSVITSGESNSGDTSQTREDDATDDILFNLNLPHTSNGASTSPHRNSTSGSTATSSSSSSAFTASLFSDVVPLDQLKLLLRLNVTGEEIQPEDSSLSSLLTPSISSSISPLELYLLSQKQIADSQLTQAIQLENASLRSRFRDEEKKCRELEEELGVARQRVQGMEAAIDGMLNGGGGPVGQNE